MERMDGVIRMMQKPNKTARRKGLPDPPCKYWKLCRFGYEKGSGGVCSILTDTDFGKRNCPFFQRRQTL